MIKLIITDLDGTLLNDNKQIPLEFWRVEQELRSKGIQWILASGRQYYTIKEQFSTIIDYVYILAENGAFVMKGDDEIHIDPMDRELANKLIIKGREVTDAWPVLCGRDSAYIENDNKSLLKEVHKYYKRLKIVDDLTKVDDLVLKLTLCDFKGAQENSFHYFTDLNWNCRIAVAGEIWLDMTNLDANKGTALKKIMDHSGIKPNEVMAFGDYMNDYDMIKIAHHSYAMKNSHPDLIEAARNITYHDNNNDGVIHELKEYFNITF